MKVMRVSAQEQCQPIPRQLSSRECTTEKAHQRACTNNFTPSGRVITKMTAPAQKLAAMASAFLLLAKTSLI